MRLLVLSDIHGNLSALEAVLRHEEKGYDLLISLGDVVGYGPNPNECVEIIAAQAAVSLAGNHELGLNGKIDAGMFSARAGYSLRWTKKQLNRKNREYISRLAPLSEYGRILLSHGSPADPVWGYIHSGPEALRAFKVLPFSLAFFGHTHAPSAFFQHDDAQSGPDIDILYGEKGLLIETGKPEQRILLNPGSVGFPRDTESMQNADKRNRIAQYALFDTVSGQWQFRQVLYDMRGTAELMFRYGLR